MQENNTVGCKCSDQEKGNGERLKDFVRCGRLCCGVHTQYEIKLSRQAKHDAENGIWSKVCMECYVGREGYMNHQGVTRSKTDILLNKRAKIIDKVHLESNRLEKRLEKVQE